jgi:hypothetical protein
VESVARIILMLAGVALLLAAAKGGRRGVANLVNSYFATKF